MMRQQLESMSLGRRVVGCWASCRHFLLLLPVRAEKALGLAGMGVTQTWHGVR
jgi:hypothetical protein